MSIDYPLQFKAAILERIRAPLVVDQVTFEGPLQPGQVLVRIDYSGICGKQIEEIQASGGADPYLPHLLGHEGSGVVVDIAPGVKTVARSDRVVLHWVKGRGIDADTPIYSRGGRRVNAGWITTFNEYAVVSENRLTVIPADADRKIAALLGCAVTTGVGVVVNEANVRPGQSLAVFGCGGVGLCSVQGGRLVNADPLIAVDTNAESLEMARRFGASHTIRADTDDVFREVKRITGDLGAEVVIVTAPDPSVLELAVRTASLPGAVYLVAVPPAGGRVSLESLAIHRQCVLTGSYGGGVVPDRDICRYLRLHEQGRLQLEELISHTVSLDDINEGIERVRSGTIGRCLVRM
ncbi:MAG: zinc-binding dehydrogenase [Sedimentisphaerales bacterium]|nr:zinc-binding dehydrogenase [Sedimentisphaerales bacterium]